jgi:hypothetical protein
VLSTPLWSVRLLKVYGFASGWPQLCRVAVPDEDVAHHKTLYSVGEEMRLLVCPRDGGIKVYSVSSEGVSLLHSATSSELILAGRIAKLSLAGTVNVLADFADVVIPRLQWPPWGSILMGRPV